LIVEEEWRATRGEADPATLPGVLDVSKCHEVNLAKYVPTIDNAEECLELAGKKFERDYGAPHRRGSAMPDARDHALSCLTMSPRNASSFALAARKSRQGENRGVESPYADLKKRLPTEPTSIARRVMDVSLV
jgi:hypothetical protein